MAVRTSVIHYEGDHEAYVVEPRDHVVLTKAQAFSKSQRLPSLDAAYAAIPGRIRCGAHGLLRGGCYMERGRDSVYCYYHEKVALGLLDHDVATYPVFPLPVHGYRFTDDVG